MSVRYNLRLRNPINIVATSHSVLTPDREERLHGDSIKRDSVVI